MDVFNFTCLQSELTMIYPQWHLFWQWQGKDHGQVEYTTFTFIFWQNNNERSRCHSRHVKEQLRDTVPVIYRVIIDECLLWLPKNKHTHLFWLPAPCHYDVIWKFDRGKIWNIIDLDHYSFWLCLTAVRLPDINIFECIQFLQCIYFFLLNLQKILAQ